MERILPFKAIRYNKNIVGDLGTVLCPPYDVISEKQQQKLYASHPFNVIRLEYGVTNEDDSETDNKYTRSADTLNEWMYSGVLLPEKQPTIYVYGQDFEIDGKQYSHNGIICLVRLDEFEKGNILPHKETLSKAKTDRLDLMMACGANFSPVYSLYNDEENVVSGILSDVVVQQPESSVKTDDGVCQKLWTIKDTEIIKQLQQALEDKQFFIADGHHRYETAINYRNIMRERNPDHTGDELYNYIMMFLADVDSPGLVVFPIHRLLRGVVGCSEQVIISQMEELFSIEKVFAENIEQTVKKRLDESIEVPSFAMYCGKDYFYFLKLKDYEFTDKINEGKSKPLRHLDVTVLHTLILGKAFGMTDADLRNQTYIGYSRDIKEAVEEVKNGNYQYSFMLNPTKLNEIKEISMANEKMPQKSTYFYPKLITGLVINKFN